MTNIFNKIQKFIEKNNLINKKDTIIIGLSGGPDSVFLLYCLNYLKNNYNLDLIAAHLDHEWRKESYKDLEFCKNLATKLNIKFESAKASEIKLNKTPKGSLEELGRVLRRTFFESLLKKYNANSIALGQHLNDQEETFFIRLIRGSSLTGLCSIWPKKDCYIRPLLELNKQEIVEYLDQNNIKYLIDITNISENFLRNRIRNNVIPEIQKADKRFDKNFEKTINNLQQTELFIDKQAKAIYKDLLICKDNKKYLNISKFLDLDKFLYTRILIYFLCEFKVKFIPSDKLFKEIIRFLKQNKSNKHQIYPDWSLVKHKSLLTIYT